MPVQRIQFTEDKDLIFEDKLQREELDISLERFGETGSTDDRHNSSRPKHARTEENVTTVAELVGLLSQEDQKQTLRSTRQISRQTGLTQFSVIPIIVFFFHLSQRMLVIIATFSYICISQGSVMAHLRCGGMYNSHVIVANCPQSVPVKELWKSVNKWRRYGQKLGGTFYGPRCT